MIPGWLHTVSILSLSLGLACALAIVWDLSRNPQNMWVMNVVWPVLALFGSLAVVWAYWRYGRLASERSVRTAKERGEEPPNKTKTPFAVMVAKATGHCGSGCAIGDLIAEWLAYFVPVVAVWFGWHTLFQDKIFAVWILDYIFAFLIGIAFQYFTITPMRHLSPGKGLLQAIKADALSLTAWQVGMYGFMAVAHFWIFGTLLGVRLEVPTVEFWFMMQIAMWCGFATAYPVNWWLVSSGIKEKM